jgi:hypothetical protein
MQLEKSITITPPPIKQKDGSEKISSVIVLKELNYLLIDNVNAKKAMVQISYIPQPLILWKDQEYDTVGDYTQQQVEDRIIELLGDDPSSVLNNLFVAPKSPSNTSNN